ncbi:MAG: aminotransferase class III-fold pyridoxal phosphate-dependent enzyme, partial [Verrucomicrobiota bacterium]
MTRAKGIAIIGMACRFPGARNVEAFWENLKGGLESITFFTPDELVAAGIDADLIQNPAYVKARSLLDDVDLFDAEFFGYSPKEAESMDPQQRFFLETAWEALENAGYDSPKYHGAIGVFAGAYMGTYLLANLCSNRESIENLLSFKKVGAFQTFLGNDKDYVTTRAAYKLNLKGPAVTVQTACSTSLVAVCQACQSLLQGQCDMALSGGVTITFPQKKGYLHQEGGMLSPDGHCRAFDARAQGTVFGSGIGLVVLKRLEDALTDGDTIHAVIKGAALNNDGSVKVSYTAPSIDGQAEVISLAQALAGVTADTITYIEAHGTGTPLGDPIEIAALTQAFRRTTDQKGFCAVGSVKTNIGHLDVAAGVAGLIKTTLALRHGLIPPSLHFAGPNPQIDFANSPFYVNARLSEWKSDGVPRRAGVSSFGVGGTNAHVVLEEAPASEPSGPSRPWQLLPISARSESALDMATKNLAAHLKKHPALPLADVAFTLQTGRRDFKHRRIVVCRDTSDAVALLESPDPKRVFTQLQERTDPSIIFMFPGQGAQYVGMGAELYRTESVFQNALDHCAELLRSELGLDLRHILYPSPADAQAAQEQLVQTRVTQPALFAVEYALAKLWMSWGVMPAAMIGHSIGEFVAGCLAGVFTLEDALRLVAGRARIVQEQPPGAMLAVRLSEAEVLPLLDQPLSIAAINSPNLCVVSGPFEAIESFEAKLKQLGAAGRRLQTSHAFHSAMMAPVIAPFTELLRATPLGTPRIPYVSNVTAHWITDAEATDPHYWAAHLRQPVRFADGVAELFHEPECVLLEVGPGQTLSTLARQHPAKPREQTVLATLPSAKDHELSGMLTTLGRLWLAGLSVNWKGFYADERRRRVPLPSYPFERKRYWVEPPSNVSPSRDRIEISSEAATNPIPPTLPTKKPLMPATQTASFPARQERILATLTAMLHELSGVELSSQDATSTFLELGFDSLFLTQARQSLQGKFGVKVTYRQLLEETPTLSALAAYIDQQLPPDALPGEPQPAAGPCGSPCTQPPPAGAEIPPPLTPPSTNGPSSTVERILSQQLKAMSQLMAQQLALLRTGDAPAITSTPPTKSSNGAPAQTPAPHAETKPFGPYRPVQKSNDGGLTTRQKQYLENLLARFTQRTGASKRFAQTHRQTLADPRSVAGFRSLWKELVYQLVIDHAQGSRLRDIDGNEYIDITMGFGVHFFGHAPQFVTEALAQQIKQGFAIGPQSPLAAEVAQLIREFTGMERVSFCNTGSEAVMAALRVARTVTGRTKIAFFSGDYHGMFDEVLLRPNTGNDIFQSLPVAPGIPPKAGQDVLILEYGSAQSLDVLRAHASELAAVLVEPVQSRHPDLQPREFLHELRRLTTQSHTALIFDEVITGFRIHPGGAQAWFDVRADLATYGKVGGGGLPIGVLAGRPGFMDALDGGFWQFGDDSAPEADMTFFAGTFVRHPLALAAAKASLLHLKEHGPALQQELNRKTSEMVGALNTFFTQQQAPIHVMHCGSLFRFHFPPEWPFAPLLIYEMLDQGIFIREAHQNCFLSTAHTDADIQRVIDAVQTGVRNLQAAEFLPGGVMQTISTAPATLSTSSQPPAAVTPASVPLTEAQKEIWLACQLGPESSCAYNESFTARLRGTLNVAALRDALNSVIARHESLHTVFSPQGDSQRILSPPASLDLPLVDLSTLNEAAQSARLAEIYAEEATLPFDLTHGPLVRVRLIKLADAGHLLVFTAHHLVCDGPSSGVLLSELGSLYSGTCQGKPCALPPPKQLREYVHALSERQRSPEGAADEAWWLNQFTHPVPFLDLPTDHPRPPARTNRGAVERRLIPSELHQALKQTGARLGCTLFLVLLSAFMAKLHRLTRQDELAVGTFASGHALMGWPRLIGHCINLLPIRSHLVGNPSFKDYLHALRRLLLDTQEHAHYTYGRLLQKLKLAREPGRSPLVEAVFNFERKGDEGVAFHGLEFEVDQNPHGFVNFDLFLNIRESAAGLLLDFEYNASLFDASTIQRWLAHYQTLLEAIVATPDQPVRELPLLDAAQRRQLLLDWNDTAADFPHDVCIHQLFETQARRTPHATALICGNERLSYRELDERAGRLAQRLRHFGAAPESLVAVCAERSPALIIGLLAVLKAGAAYVPLDPAYPAERLKFILEDAQSRLLLTSDTVRAGLEFNLPDLTVVNLDAFDSDFTGHVTPAPAVTPANLAYVIYTSGSTGNPKGVAI